MSDLPSGWTQTSIENIFAPLADGRTLHQGWSPQCEKEPSKSEDDWAVLKTTAIQYGSFLPVHNKRLPEHLDPRPIIEVEQGDILITCAGPRARCGVACLVPRTRPRLMMSGKMYRFRVSGQYIDPKYIAFYLQTPEARLAIDNMKTGGSDSGLNLTHDRFRRLPALVAPLAEQKRIVAAIEEQFSRLDSGVAALERVRQNLKRMRSAVLEGVVSEALGYTDQQMTAVKELLSEPLANGKSVPDGTDIGFPVLRLTAVRDGWVDVACSKRGAWTVVEARSYLIKEGDYLVVRGNGSKRLVGRGALVSADAEVAYPDTMIRLRFDRNLVLPVYASLIWDSMTIRNQIEQAARTTAGIYKINQKDLAQISFPVPSVDEQVKILSSADRILGEVNALEAKINCQLKRSKLLRMSILSSAFTGTLVAQDPADEPASVLLERISAERPSPTATGRRPPRARKPQGLREEVTA